MQKQELYSDSFHWIYLQLTPASSPYIKWKQQNHIYSGSCFQKLRPRKTNFQTGCRFSQWAAETENHRSCCLILQTYTPPYTQSSLLPFEQGAGLPSSEIEWNLLFSALSKCHLCYCHWCSNTGGNKAMLPPFYLKHRIFLSVDLTRCLKLSKETQFLMAG